MKNHSGLAKNSQNADIICINKSLNGIVTSVTLIDDEVDYF